MTTTESDLAPHLKRDYKEGFITDIDSETLPPGLDEDVIRFISKKKNEPDWMLEWRLDGFRRWQEMTPPEWAHLSHPPVNFQEISYFFCTQAKTAVG